MDRQTYDKERVHFNVARLKTHGHNFEVVVDPDKALAFRVGKLSDIREAIKADGIFHDAKKGEVAPENLMREIFGTSESLEVASKIIMDGEVQLTAEHREKLRQQKEKAILDIIHRNAVDPRTGHPHPMVRIENAFREAKVKVDEHKSAEDQIKPILKSLMPILPIKFEVKEVQIHLRPEHASKAYGVLQKYGKILKEGWQNDGSWLGVLEIPGGLELELYDSLNNITHGQSDIKVIGEKK